MKRRDREQRVGAGERNSRSLQFAREGSFKASEGCSFEGLESRRLLSITFEQLADYPVANRPTWAVAADFNLDGDQDVAVSINDSYRLSVFFGNGDGTLSGPSTYSTSGSTSCVAAADVDNDGDVDLGVSLHGTSLIQLFINDGTGIFVAPIEYPSGSDPLGIAFADLDGDGWNDLLTTHNSDNTLGVCLNNQDGTFAPMTTYPTGTGPLGLVVADLDANMTLDVVVADNFSNTLSLFYGNGTGGLSARTAVVVGTGYSRPVWVAAGDLNGDGAIDLASSNYLNSLNSGISVLINDGTGADFSQSSYPTGSAPVGIAIGDLDHDGRGDVAVSSSLGPYTSVFKSDTDGALLDRADWPGGDPACPVLEDMDGDGQLDMVVANNGANNIRVFRNSSPVSCPPPMASFTISDPTPDEGQIVTFDATSSMPGTGCSIGSYLWDLDNDGQFDDASGAMVLHSFPDNAAYTVRLQVVQDDGQPDSQSQSVSVQNAAPTANIENTGPVAEGSQVSATLTDGYDPSTGDITAGLRYCFTLNASELDGIGYADASVLNSWSHTFDDNGTYTVYARVLDKDGGFSDYQTTISVTNIAPPVTITDIPTSPVYARTVTSLGTSVLDPSPVDAAAGFTYVWSLTRNGEPIVLPTVVGGPNFNFAPDRSGTYEVTVIVYDKDGGNSPAVATINVLPAAVCVVAGSVWLDLNNDGQIDFGERGISDVQVRLTGIDDLGNPVDRMLSTAPDGVFMALDLRPGAYCLEELQPAGCLDGGESLGTGGGSVVTNDKFCDIVIAEEGQAVNYNFGERPMPGQVVEPGQTATIGFWQNKNGQNLIKAFDDSPAATRLGDWLAATLPNLFGANAGASSLAGMTNTQVAEQFRQRFILKGVKVDAQVMATALSVYATTQSLGGPWAAGYGFTVSAYGLANSTFSVGVNGAAFGVGNGTMMTVLDLLQAADARAVNGVLYGGNATLRKMCNDVFSAINEAGDR